MRGCSGEGVDVFTSPTGVGIGQLEHLEIRLWLLIPGIRIGKGNAYISCFLFCFQ